MHSESWKELVEVVASSQSSEDNAQVELLSISESEEAAAKHCFWLNWLKADTEAAGYAVPATRANPLRVLSACSGSFAEAAVLKELTSTVKVTYRPA